MNTRGTQLPLAALGTTEAVGVLGHDLSVGICPVFANDSDILLAHNEAVPFLQTVPDGTARLVVSSPPYNIGKPYEQRTDLNQYLDWQRAVLAECVRILQPGGSLCWQVGNHVDSGEVFPLDVFFYRILREDFGLKLRNRIVWHFEHGLHAKKRLSGRYEMVLWFTKGEPYVFNLRHLDMRVYAAASEWCTATS